MALAEQRELEEEEDEQEESLEEEIAAGAGETMTEADCKELWRIYPGDEPGIQADEKDRRPVD